MVGIHTNIDNALDKEFRLVAGKKFGLKKGAFGRVLEEALRMWIANNKAD